MAWIELHAELLDHPKVDRLAGALEIKRGEAIYHLLCFWHWTLKYAEHGNVTQFSDAEIAHGARFFGDEKRFVTSLREGGWLDLRGDHVLVHDWMDYAGHVVKARERLRRFRRRQQRSMNVLATLHETRQKRCRNVAETTNPNPNPNPNPNQERVRGPTPAAKAFLDLFHRLYVDRYGTKPAVNRYDVRNLAPRVKQLDNGDAEKLILAYFAEDCYVGHPLQKLYQASVWDRMRGKLRGETGLQGKVDYYGVRS